MRTSRGPAKARFEEIYSGGKRAQSAHVRAIALPGAGLVGFATSKKLGSIARRNRLKRIARAAVREFCEPLPTLDVIVVLGAEAIDMPYRELGEELRALFGRVSQRWAESSESS